MLSSHIDPDELIQAYHDHPPHHRGFHSSTAVNHNTPYSSRYASISELSKFRMPHDGAPADAVHQMLKDEYPAMMQMHSRCVSILSHLWGVQKGEKAVGTATTGSSEAIHLGGLAMKRRWQEKRQAEGKPTDKPNIIMGANAQVALEKFARYFEVEARILPVSEKSLYRLDPDLVRENIDENTIGVFVILGSTYTGHYEPVEEISKILDEYEAKTGVDIPIHVDGASGAFIAPFTHAQAGGTKWNFELPRVKSINVSGHKFGLVYAGVGWIIWRDEAYLPKHLIFELHYLGGTEESYTLNFSRPGAQIIAQYFNLIHLGFTGYRTIMENALSNARLLSRALEATGWYECVSDIHRKKGDHKYEEGKKPYDEGENSAAYNAGLPVVAFTLSKKFKEQFPHVKQVSISNLLRSKQYIIPNYPLPPNEEKTEILRVVVRESMSLDLLDRLITDICAVTESVMQSDAIDLAAWQPFANTIEKTHGSRGVSSAEKHKAKRPMHHAPPDDQPSPDEDDHYYDRDDYFYNENYYYDGDDYFYDEDHHHYYYDEDGYYSDQDYEYSDEEYDEEYDEDAPHYYDDDDNYGNFNSGYANSRDVERHHASSNHHDHNRNYDGREPPCAHALGTHDWPLSVTVRAEPMAYELRDLARVATAEFYAERVVERMGFEDRMLAARLASVLDQVEYYALPAINAWNEQHEGQAWEVRELRDEWMYAITAPGRVTPFVFGLVGVLSEYMLAEWFLAMGV
ncbi:Glutamate decarboxylase [Lasiodiplodia hormozganensis]|uniref:Glutamate decarboxylase n=1 Tax=Lasiodiplodia hormozganensis TaxID=869390 RepID=A0AA39YJI9_9PEZI|nr:Glutamate decarboxylase [Lasiodiplodia hormozganensis]